MTGIVKQNEILKFALLFLMAVMLAACSTDNTYYAAGQEIHDPFEEVNRVTFAFNDTVDQAIAKPVAEGYVAVVPSPARTGIRNFLRNLRTPVNAANQLLQGDIEGMARDLSRATINTSFGIGGLIDIAADTGIEYEHEDFGQTLAVWGVNHGPYIVLPLAGPSSARDTVGKATDLYLDPLRLYLFNVDEEGWEYARRGAQAVSTRAELLNALETLRENSIDYYAALRSAYYQKRAALVNDRDPDTPGAPIPDYDDPEFDDSY